MKKKKNNNNNNNKIEKENSPELQASINGKNSINVLLFASFSFFPNYLQQLQLTAVTG